MKSYHTRFVYFMLVPAFILLTAACESQSGKEKEVQLNEWTPKFGGCGGVFINAKKGPLVFEIEKENLRPGSGTRLLRATFVGPDRKLLQDIQTSETEDNGNFLRFETHVAEPGIYAVMVTISNDRYGDHTAWKFRTNAGKYIIETSRGHKDQYHEEPIVLLDPDKATELCFLPQRNAFDILVTGLTDSIKTIELQNADNQLIASIQVNNDTARFRVKEGERSSVPWKLNLSQAKAKIEIEGVTRWDRDDKSDYFHEYMEGAFWTPHQDSWFNLHENRWLITPYSHTRYVRTGEQQSATFKIHNNGTAPRKVNLKLEFPGKKWAVHLSSSEVTLEPNQEEEIQLSWKGDQQDQSVHLRATCGEFSTYSTLYAKSDPSFTGSSLTMPIILAPFHHEQEQFGYYPDYPTHNQPYFDADNQPYVVSDNSILSFHNGAWNQASTGSLHSTSVAFDSDGDVYVLGQDAGNTVLLHSTDKGQNFISYPIPGGNNSRFDIEYFSGHNLPKGPPPVVKYTRTGADRQHFWRRYGNLELLIPKKTDNGIEWEEPILISDKCLGVSSHSGLPPSLVSRDDKVFVVWGEVTDVDISRDEIPGVPVFVAMYDKEKKSISTPVRVGFGPPPNDTHNIPGISMDSEGYLHVLTGTHGRPFQYARSLKPASVNDGWTKAEPLIDQSIPYSTQTYLGLVIDKENTLHTIFRLWQHNVEPHPETHYATLGYMSKKAGQNWSEPIILVQAPLSHYSNFRHRLTIDRKGRLFVSYYYWSTYWFYRNDRKYTDRTLLMSPDGGKNWSLVSEEDFTS